MKILLRSIYSIILVFSIISCETNKDERMFYRIEKYKNGTIKDKRIYENQFEYDLNKNFQRFTYYPDGALMEIINYKDGKIDGDYFGYEETGEQNFISSFEDGNEHGITKIFDNNGKILSKSLYINNHEILWEQFTVYQDDGSYGYTIFEVKEDGTELEVGYYLVDNDHIPIDTEGNYYIINTLADTIVFSQKYKFEIEFLLSSKNVSNSEIKIGDIDIHGNFIDSLSTSNYKFDRENAVSITLDSTHLGKNLLLGKIYVTQDTIINKQPKVKSQVFLFYHEFYVKEWLVMPDIFNKFIPKYL